MMISRRLREPTECGKNVTPPWYGGDMTSESMGPMRAAARSTEAVPLDAPERLPGVQALGEAALLRAVLSRDQRAWREFVRRYEPHIREVMRDAASAIYELPDDQVDDLVGDLWLLLLENDLRRLRGLRANHDGAVCTWLRLFASQLACNYARKVARAPKMVPIDEADARAISIAPPQELDSPMMDVEAVARRWGVNVKTVYAMIQRGELRAVRVGRLVRVARSVVQSYEQASVEPERKKPCR
jgi:excisionase family DNA binding protein